MSFTCQATAIVYFVACILSNFIPSLHPKHLLIEISGVQNGVGIHQWNIKASSLGHGYLIVKSNNDLADFFFCICELIFDS